MKRFREQHPEFKRKMVKYLSRVAVRGIQAELGDLSSDNIKAVTLAVANNVSRELLKYCMDEGILANSRRARMERVAKSTQNETSF